MSIRPITKSLIDIKRFKVIRRIWIGGGGAIYLIEEIQTTKQYIGKIIFSNNTLDDERDKMIDREIGIMLTINHPTLVKIYGFSLTDFNDEPNVTIIMELAKNGSLADLIKKVQLAQAPIEYTNTLRQIILIGIARGMKYLHDRNIIHRDLSTHNVLIDDYFYPIITDFGMSKYFENDESEENSTYGGKYQYMAPEIIRGEPYGRKADVFSFAIIMYQVITDKVPFPDFVNRKITGYQLNNLVAHENHRPIFNQPIKNSIKKLIESCWSNNSKERPNFKEIFNKLTDLSDVNSEESCILDDVDTDAVQAYIDMITDKNDPVERLIEESEKIGRELAECKKEKESLMHKVAGLEELNKELCKNLKEKNKSFMLGYPSDSFSENYRKILEIKKNDQDVSITVNICSDMKENDTTFQNDKNINQVIFGDSVSSIQNYSFKGCTSLRTVLISNSVTSIGDRAFEGCSSLLQITIPSSVQNTASLVFGCDPMLMIHIPQSIKDAGPFADIDKYEINKLINDTYAFTFKVTNKETKEEFALIAFDENRPNFAEDWVEFYISVKISQIGLPGILPYEEFRFPLSPEEKEKVKTQMLDLPIPFDHEFKIDLTHNILIQKYLKNGNLSKLTKNYLLQRKGDNILNPTVRSKIIFGIACTMKQLHARNVFHRNLKFQDILLDENHEPKIASFYLAKFLNSPKENEKNDGTPSSMAPEVFATDNAYEAFPVDVYSYAFFLYMMFSPVLPNSSIDKFMFMRKINHGWRPEKPKMIPEHYWDLIQMCWHQNPEKRPTFAEITRILLNDKYALEEFGVKTDLEKLHEYQIRINKY